MSRPVILLITVTALLGAGALLLCLLDGGSPVSSGPQEDLGEMRFARSAVRESREGDREAVERIATAPRRREATAGKPGRSQAREAFPDPLGGPHEVVIRGRVRDAQGTPLPLASVEVFENVARTLVHPLGERRLASLQTAQDGRFRFALTAGLGADFILRVTHPDHSRAWVLPVDPLRPQTLDVDVLLAPARDVTGVVTAAGGGPVSGAALLLYDLEAPTRQEDHRLEREATSGEDGRYVLHAVSSGRKRLLVRAPGYTVAARDPLHIAVEGDVVPVSFVLEPGKTLAGRVVDADTGTGIALATVSMRPVSLAGARGVHPGEETRAAGDGTFRMEGLPAGTWIVRALAPGYARSTARNVRAEDEDVVLKLRQVARVSGRVIDAGGHPVADCAVVAGTMPDPSSAPWQSQARTGADGRFTLEAVPVARRVSLAAKQGGAGNAAGAETVAVGSVWIFARAFGYGGGRLGPLQLERGQVLQELEIVVQKGAVITGRVLDDQGAPLGGATVTLLRKVVLPHRQHAEVHQVHYERGDLMAPSLEATTFADGSFLLVALDAGSYSILARASDVFATKESGVVTVATGEEMELPDIQLERSAGIEGVVLDGEGLPDGRAVVGVLPLAGNGPRRSAPTDASGTFRIMGLPPGSYRVAVLQRSGRFDVDALVRSNGGEGLKVDLSQGVVEKLELRGER